ncbi:sensor histidine kinase [Anaeropeptidivorans aminofermentans]|uniref:sensor histidine kinase n=1 Tax=Anaeropeptidivorans aminofermentans TaxID=2934315 RepID=UPI002025AE2A|nr:HAMP domain-containing sensor histidine kinase [Anaeropeptidivorans aminofermentans]
MKRHTIRWRIFKYNLIMISMLIVLVSITFNIVVGMYMERDVISQLDKITIRTVNTALHQRPSQFPEFKRPPDSANDSSDDKSVSKGNAERKNSANEDDESDIIFRYYLSLNRSLNEPLSITNADYILLDKEKNLIPSPITDDYDNEDLSRHILEKIKDSSEGFSDKEYLKLNISGTDYIAVVRPLSETNSADLGWIIIFSSLQKVNQLQYQINGILFIILFFISIIAMLLSSNLSKKLSKPFASLTSHIKEISERNFGNKVQIAVYEELQEMVNGINIMSEKLKTYDKAQKTFLQNVSHEFRTPLMSIQSYAEGIKYDVVDKETAVDIILDESKRMASLIGELLYLSRLETIEENYRFEKLNVSKILHSIVDRMNRIALQENINITAENINEEIEILADVEKFSRAITNIISNCIRYAESSVNIEAFKENNTRLIIKIYDDGNGCDAGDISHIFERFYKGRKGNFGLGLSISKNVIERHGGKISVQNQAHGGALFTIELEISSEEI